MSVPELQINPGHGIQDQDHEIRKLILIYGDLTRRAAKNSKPAYLNESPTTDNLTRVSSCTDRPPPVKFIRRRQGFQNSKPASNGLKDVTGDTR